MDIFNEFPDFHQLLTDELLDRYLDDNLKLISGTFPKNIVQVSIIDKQFLLKRDYEYTVQHLLDIMFAQIPKSQWLNYTKHLKNKKIVTTDTKKTKIQKLVKIVKEPQPEEFDPNYMCIYSDIIKPQMMGNIMARCMLMHPVKYVDKYQIYEAPHIQYYPIERQHITEINMLLTNERGEPINFENSTFCTMILLHFEKGI